MGGEVMSADTSAEIMDKSGHHHKSSVGDCQAERDCVRGNFFEKRE
jgi:hypothetical protein